MKRTVQKNTSVGKNVDKIVLDTFAEKELNLREYVRSISENGILQRTPQWLEEKKYKIGGSSIATILGKNPYSSTEKMLAEGLGLIERNIPSIFLHWGNLFEDVIKSVAEEQFCCNIIGDKLFIPAEGPWAYSPDGFAVIAREDLIDIGFSAGKNKISTVLFEFKCPFRRALNGEVPHHYLPQVKMGLDIAPIADFAIYAEGVFRRCSIEGLLSDRYISHDRVCYNSPIRFGVFGFYIPNDSALRGSERLNPQWSAKYDIGAAPKSEFEDLIARKDCGEIYSWSTSIAASGSDAASEIKDFEIFCESGGHIPIGVMSWKLFSIAFHQIFRTLGYLSPTRKLCDLYVQTLRDGKKEGAQRSVLLELFCKKISSPELFIHSDCQK